MGRKKKIQTPEKPPVEVVKEEKVKKVNETPLVYSGEATIKLKVGTKVIQLHKHNAGLKALKLFFCKCIVNDSDSATYRPQFIDLRYANSSTASEADWISILYNKAVISSRVWEYSTDQENYIAVLSATIPKSLIQDDVSEMVDKSFRFYLCNNKEGREDMDLAYLPVSQEYLQLIVPGTSAIVEWTMQLLNEQEVRG